MARNHRKLFPSETPTNQTGCSGLCDPACPYNCYSYPEYYFTPPPPSISASENSSHANHISSYLIVLISLFAVIFILVSFYVIKIKCYATWCGWRLNRSVPSQANNAEEEFLHENQVDHPVWLIATVGIQQSIINSITACKYRKDEGLIEGTECAVCLNEFREGETLRLLPKCNHAFHIPCIDTWLRSHTNCPLCRAGIVSNNPNPDAAMSNSASLVQENTNLGRNQEMRMDNLNNDGGFSSNTIANGDSENRTGTGEASEAVESTDELSSKEGVNVDRYYVHDAPSGPIENHGVINDEVQAEIMPVPTESENHVVDHIQEGDNSNTSKTMRRSSIEECLHISPVSMKRSFSYSGRIQSTRGYISLNKTLPY